MKKKQNYMKEIFLLFLCVVFIGCSSEDKWNPENLTKIELGNKNCGDFLIEMTRKKFTPNDKDINFFITNQLQIEQGHAPFTAADLAIEIGDLWYKIPQPKGSSVAAKCALYPPHERLSCTINIQTPLIPGKYRIIIQGYTDPETYSWAEFTVSDG